MTATYQSLHTDSFLTVNLDFTVLKENFIVLNEFMKNFSQFQKKFNDMQKMQKATSQDFSSFKLSTSSQLQTINQTLESRGQISQGKSSAATEQLEGIKKSIKQLKQYMAESTRQQHQAQQIREKQNFQTTQKIKTDIKNQKTKQSQTQKICVQLEKKLYDLSLQAAKKTQFMELNIMIQRNQSQIDQNKQNLANVQKILKQTKVEEFKAIIDNIDAQVKEELGDMKMKFNSKCNITDLMKLEEMMLNMVQYTYQNCIKILANKGQTKKALIFLQKRMNSLIVTLLGEDENQREALITSKQIKCISCSKDLGQAEGKLDKFKPWNVFPVKQPNIKDKYSGFGAGFQSIIQTTVAKKGGQISYDQKGRMVSPFNLTSTMQGTFMKTSKSQHKIQTSDPKYKNTGSPSKTSLKYQTTFMFQFGKDSNNSNNGQIDVANDYYDKYKGLQNFILSNGKTYQATKK